jgi:molybdenum cofactor guanylyltransferase/molybdopterin-guanine dinucleotide biosynthesis protein MobB
VAGDLRSQITGVILAGGRGRRLGGVDKGLVEIDGRPLAVHVLEALRPQVARVVINANRNRERYAALGCEVVADAIAGYYGPLAGIASAMEVAETPYLLTVPCDGPLLPTDLATRLHARLIAEDADLCVAHDGGRLQPIFALLRCTLLPRLTAYVEGGGHKVEEWCHQQSLAVADFSDCASAFINVNTPADRAALERRVAPGALADLPVPILGFAAFSGTGKTTLLCRLIPMLKERGVRVAMVKHAHHAFDIDTPGKDSYELRKSGADQMLVASSQRWALMVEDPHDDRPDLERLVALLDPERADLILVEGFKDEPIPKIELHRTGLNQPLLFPDDDAVIAVATDGSLPVATQLPVLDLNDPTAIADFVCTRFLGKRRA